MRVHQLLTSLAPGDAVSNHALHVQKVLRSAGFESEIFAEYLSESMSARGHNLERFLREDAPDAILLAHYSIASSSMVALPEYKSRKILVYHNVTPYEYLVDIYPLMAFHCLRGRTDLRRIAPSIKYGIAFSRYSERELIDAGVQHTAVMPLLLDMSRLKLPPDPVTIQAFSNANERRILVVGRVVPNKKVEEAIKIVSMLPRSRLIVADLTLVARNTTVRWWNWQRS